MAEQKKAWDEFELKCNGVIFDTKIVTSKDVAKNQFSTSYTTAKYKLAGSLVVKEWKMDDDDGTKLVGVTFDIVQPAKTEKQDEIDEENEYVATCTMCE